ncbi:MAG: carboxypeptidase-like regulatory domain-containing protein [Bacteroidota bacterium]
MYPNHILKLPHHLVLGLLLLLSFPSSSQRTVSGTVRDEYGETLPGVHVLVVGSGNELSTDLDGKYRIVINADSSQLRFTFVGFLQQEVTVGTRSVIDIVLEEDEYQLQDLPIMPSAYEAIHGQLTTEIILGIPGQPWGGSVELMKGGPKKTLWVANYRRQGGRNNRNFEQASLAVTNLLKRGSENTQVGLMAQRLEQGEASRSLAYSIWVTEHYFPRLLNLSLGFGGGQYGDFPSYSLSPTYLRYQAGLSQYFDLNQHEGIGLITSLNATYWDRLGQNTTPVDAPPNFWGWVGYLSLRLDHLQIWAEHRQVDVQRLTSLGASYSFRFRPLDTTYR